MDEPSLPRLTYPPRGPSCYSQAGHALDDHFLHKYYYIYIYIYIRILTWQEYRYAASCCTQTGALAYNIGAHGCSRMLQSTLEGHLSAHDHSAALRKLA